MARARREPPASQWDFDVDLDSDDDVVAIGADLEPGTLLAAYRQGLFPMGLGRHGAGPIGWWAPQPRGVLWPQDLRVSRSLRRSVTRYRTTVDSAFAEVVTACADPSRSGRWITPAIATAYEELFERGFAHSIEVWDGDELVGGLYGLGLGGFFAGESMFHRSTDASKVALVRLCDLVASAGPGALVDVQWSTPHLASLGVVELDRRPYLAALATALALPDPTW